MFCLNANFLFCQIQMEKRYLKVTYLMFYHLVTVPCRRFCASIKEEEIELVFLLKLKVSFLENPSSYCTGAKWCFPRRCRGSCWDKRRFRIVCQQ